MLNRWITLILVALLALPALVISPVAGAQEGPPQTGLRPDAPTYALHGPYWVGTREFVIDPEAERPTRLQVWYPALNPDGAAETITYVMKWSKYQFEGLDTSVSSDIAGHALADAQADVGAAPYPLVLFSHGSGTEPVIYSWLMEHMASYGFVVIGIDHQEIIDAANSDLVRSTIARPQSIPIVLDYAVTLTAPDGALPGMIDLERVAVAGQSYGGYTALAAAGARYDMVAYKERCDALAADDPNQFLCGFANSADEMAQSAKLDAVPQELWPAMSDARVDALITIAGDSYMFGEQGLAEITMPMLAIGGTLDTATPYDWGVRPTYDHASSQQKILATFENAGHFMAMTSCADAPSIVDTLGSFYFCSDPVWDMDRAHDLISHFTTAFLLATLRSDANAAAALAADQVAFPGVTYEAQGY